MAKKRENPTWTAPITRKEYEAFVAIWQKMKPTLKALEGPSTGRMEKPRYYSNEDYVWARSDGYSDITPEGVVFYQMEDVPYENYQTPRKYVIPLENILDPDPVINKSVQG